MMKKDYEKPVMEVIQFDTKDVITTSGLTDEDYMTDIIPDEQ